jgi:uncharacterized membrane protein
MSDSNFESNKNLAGIGSLLLIFPIVDIVGIILLYIGMKGLSDHYKEPSIYQEALWGLIYGIIASVALGAGVILAGTVGFFTFGVGAVLTVFAAIVVVFIFYILAAMHFRKAFSTLALKSGENNFNTAGTLLWWGAILTIIFVGLILIFIAWIFATIAFFSMKLQPQQPYASPQPGYTPPTATSVAQPTQAPVTQPTQATRYCPNCGAPVAPNTAFCPHCGKQLPQ